MLLRSFFSSGKEMNAKEEKGILIVSGSRRIPSILHQRNRSKSKSLGRKNKTNFQIVCR
jgi:hypothetical protein